MHLLLSLQRDVHYMECQLREVSQPGVHCKKSGGHIPPNMFPTLGVMSHHDAGGGTLPLYGGIVPLDISVMSHNMKLVGQSHYNIVGVSHLMQVW